ncbi:hypothetical protein FIBSPDRAFT_439865 [Athelia psychrophila]|uniref:Hydrophobin n=1 Tax=Athelia psychrophila TaxID=1759441 RepID=A0A166ME60_9AGAM|nr:hypothetical protein FIBSPDRAFT_439865 [Fibularhizoctonia sp. CBS 109695]
MVQISSIAALAFIGAVQYVQADTIPGLLAQAAQAALSPMMFKPLKPQMGASNPLAELLKFRGVQVRGAKACPSNSMSCNGSTTQCCPIGGTCCSGGSACFLSRNDQNNTYSIAQHVATQANSATALGAARPISMDAGTTPVALQARLAVKAEDAVNPASTAWQPAPV